MKRFTDSEKWGDPWFRRLSMHDKLFWLYVCDKCDNAGVWNVDLDLAAFQIGHSYDAELLLKIFDGRVEDLGNGRWLIRKYVTFQWGTLTKKSPPHHKVIKLLEQYGLSIDSSKGITYPTHCPTHRVVYTLEEEREEEEEKEKGESEGDLVQHHEAQIGLREISKMAYGLNLGVMNWGSEYDRLLNRALPLRRPHFDGLMWLYRLPRSDPVFNDPRNPAFTKRRQTFPALMENLENEAAKAFELRERLAVVQKKNNQEEPAGWLNSK